MNGEQSSTSPEGKDRRSGSDIKPKFCTKGTILNCNSNQKTDTLNLGILKQLFEKIQQILRTGLSLLTNLAERQPFFNNNI